MTLKAIESFVATVDPLKTTVVSFPEFIAVFGGAVSSATGEGIPLSQRDAFVRWLRLHRRELVEYLLIPENYDDWSDFNVYSDLLLFEKDLGYLTSAVLVFLEGPGAIAELGAFSQIDSLRERLVVVIASDHRAKRSFITLGPIRSITETHRHKDGLCVIPNVEPIGLDEHVPVILDTLSQKRYRPNSSTAFNRNDEQHQMLLILDFVNLFLAVQLTELQSLSAHFGAVLDIVRLKQILFVLEKTQLITAEEYGKVTYYVPRNFKRSYQDYAAKDGARPFKRETAKAKTYEEISQDKFRRFAYGQATKKEASK